MLLRPPFIQQQDVKSQSENSHLSRQRLNKSLSKNKLKQNSLAMKKNYNNIVQKQKQINYTYQNSFNQQNKNKNIDYDNQSINSINSKKSKSKTKQSTIGKGNKLQTNYNNQNHYQYMTNNQHNFNTQNNQINLNTHKNQATYSNLKNPSSNDQPYQIFKLDDQNDSQNDKKSIGSHTSKNSKNGNKNRKKQNSLMGNFINKNNSQQLNYNYGQKQQNNLQNKQGYQKQNNYVQDYSQVKKVNVQDEKKQLGYNQYNQNKNKFSQVIKVNQNIIKPVLKQENYQKRIQKNQRQSFSPFEEIILKKQSEQSEQEPIYKLKQHSQDYKQPKNIFQQKIQQNKPKIQSVNKFQKGILQNQNLNSKQSRNQIQKLQLQQSHTIQPQLINTKSVATKSRRNKIFDNDNDNANQSISNASNVLTNRSGLDGSFQKSRSKSKLGGLLKESRQKKNQNTQFNKDKQETFFLVEKVQKIPEKNNYEDQKRVQIKVDKKQIDNFFNLEKLSTLNSVRPLAYQNNLTKIPKIATEQSRIGGQKLGQNFAKMNQIQKKNIQNQVFDLGQSQFDLNLSMSHKITEPIGLKGIQKIQNPNIQNIKTPQSYSLKGGDSLHFNFEPQKKKGISIIARQKNQVPSINLGYPQQVQNLQSRKHLDRLMKKCQQNQQFLAKSILSNNSQLLIESRKPTFQQLVISLNNIKQTQQKIEIVNQQNGKIYINPFEKINQGKTQKFQKQKQKQKQDIQWFKNVQKKQQFKIKQVQRKQVIKNPKQGISRPNNRFQQPLIKNLVKPVEELKSYTKQNSVIDNRIDISSNKFFQSKQQNKNNKQISYKYNQNKIQKQQIKGQQKQQYESNYNNNKIQYKNNKKNQCKILQNIQKINNVQKKYMFTDKQNQRLQSPKRSSEKNKVKQSSLMNAQSKISNKQSQLSHEFSLSDQGSERSNSQNKKNKKKQSSLNIMKKHKVQVRDQSPRAQQSFYQERSKYQQPQKKNQSQKQLFNNFKQPQTKKLKNKNQYKQPNLINFHQSQSEQPQIKSKTDLNFYNYGDASQRSMKPPSSKPPLSRKSNASSSKSKTKAKQSTININVTKKQNTLGKDNNNSKNNGQKRNLLDIAKDKSYQGSAYNGSDSQCSFDSRQSFDSANSRGSKRSSNSKKQSTLNINVKSNKQNYIRPPMNRINSNGSQIQSYNPNQSHYSRLQNSQTSGYQNNSKSQQKKKIQQRTIVSKNTYFIDERGRLVKQDLIIKGNHVYGQPNQNQVQQMAYQRMKRSRQYHRSRSKSREGSRSRLSKNQSINSYGNQSSTYFDQNDQGSTYYENQRPNLYIEQFIKPIVQQPLQKNMNSTNSNQYKNIKYSQPQRYSKPQRGNYQRQNQYKNNYIEKQFYENQQQQQSYYERYEQEQPVKNITLNELFGRNNKPKQEKHVNNNDHRGNNQWNQTNNFDQSNVRSNVSRNRSMKRTQKFNGNR